MKSLVLSLQETEKDKEGYPEKAEGMLATVIAGERRRFEGGKRWKEGISIGEGL